MKQIILSILSNAGGVGKTTLAVHIAYSLAERGFKVVMIDLDPQRSLDVFCGIPPQEAPSSAVHVFSKNFKGDWPIVPVWANKVDLCQGHPLLAEMANELVIRKRGEYALADRLKSYPLPHNLIILDCPATLGMLNTNALATSTHILVPVQLEMKAISGAAELIEWCINTSEELQLDPKPTILGFVPSMYDEKVAMHRQYLEQLPEIASRLDVKLYPKVRNSNEFKNASAYGQPLHSYRPKHPATKDFKQIIDDIVALIKEKSEVRSQESGVRTNEIAS